MIRLQFLSLPNYWQDTRTFHGVLVDIKDSFQDFCDALVDFLNMNPDLLAINGRMEYRVMIESPSTREIMFRGTLKQFLHRYFRATITIDT